MQFVDQLKRRKFITLIGGAVACPFVAHAQQPGTSVIAFINGGSAEASARFVAAFHKGLDEVGFMESQNVAVEYHWLNGQYDRLETVNSDMNSRRFTARASRASNRKDSTLEDCCAARFRPGCGLRSSRARAADAGQQFLYVGADKGITVVDRKTLDVVGTIQPSGILGPGHHIATDSKGNIYLAQTTAGMQKLVFKGMPPTQ